MSRRRTGPDSNNVLISHFDKPLRRRRSSGDRPGKRDGFALRGDQGTGAVEIGFRRDREKRVGHIRRRADRHRRVASEERPRAVVQRHGGVRSEHRRLVAISIVVRQIDGDLCRLSRTGAVARRRRGRESSAGRQVRYARTAFFFFFPHSEITVRTYSLSKCTYSYFHLFIFFMRFSERTTEFENRLIDNLSTFTRNHTKHIESTISYSAAITGVSEKYYALIKSASFN